MRLGLKFGLAWLLAAAIAAPALAAAQPARDADGTAAGSCRCGSAPLPDEMHIKLPPPAWDADPHHAAIGWERLTYAHRLDREELRRVREQERAKRDKLKAECRRRCANMQPCPFCSGWITPPPLERDKAKPQGKARQSGCGCGGQAGATQERDDCHCKRTPKEGPSGTTFLRDGSW
jgi:hypothetical protein